LPAAPGERLLVSVLSLDMTGSPFGIEPAERHAEALHGEFLAAEGREISRAGGKVLAVFQRPTRSIQCAIAIRDRMRRSGVEVRSAVHIGECEQRGDQFSGAAVELSSRLLDHVLPGEIIASRTVRDLVVGSGLRFEERGEMSANGLPGAFPFYSVDGAYSA
jgi:class 3 adenylate cyclase